MRRSRAATRMAVSSRGCRSSCPTCDVRCDETTVAGSGDLRTTLGRQVARQSVGHWLPDRRLSSMRAAQRTDSPTASGT